MGHDNTNRGRTTRASLGALAIALLLCAFASPALAAPTHPRDEARDITGLNHACGTAVDSKGDVYLSSAGTSEVKVYDPSHTLLTSIPNSNEPCGLAVTTTGNLYVSEQATGEVVRFKPNAYPFAGTPTYGAPVTIDSSGQAEGISVDATDDRLYVAKGDHISVYKPDGGFLADVGEGPIGDAKGVAVYRSSSEEIYLAIADSEDDVLRIFSGQELAGLKQRKIVGGVDHDRDPKTGDQEFSFGPAGTSVGVDPTTGYFLIYDDAHQVVNELDASGEFLDQIEDPEFVDGEPTGLAVFPDRDEIQRVTYSATGGTFILSFEGAPTEPLDYDSTAPEMQAALEALPGVGSGQVTVYGGYSTGAGSFRVQFRDDLGGLDVSQLTPDDSGLVGSTVSIETLTPGSGPGRVYVSVGPASGGKVLAFGPLARPDRRPLPQLSHVLATARAVVADRDGNVYAAAGTAVHIFDPAGIEVGEFEPMKPSVDLAVDSDGGVYSLENVNVGDDSQERVRYYAAPGYTSVTTVATGGDFAKAPIWLRGIGINTANDHLLVVAYTGQVIELGAATEGWPVVTPCFACGSSITAPGDIAAYGANGYVYISEQFGRILVVNQTGTEVVTRINGAGSPLGAFPSNPNQLAVDQSNGHVLAFSNDTRGAVEEYDGAGTFIGRFVFPEPQGFNTEIVRGQGIAIDNSGGSSDGNLYVAFDDTKPGTPDLWAFGPLSYGEAPIVETGIASGVGGGEATLNGTVDPRGFDLDGCHFEYLGDAEYEVNLDASDPPFQGAATEACVPGPGGIGAGTGAVPVSADLSGLEAGERYRFRVIAENKYGQGSGEPGLFGPPLVVTKEAQPVLYGEATLRGGVDPSGLVTTYRFEYGSAVGEYDQVTPTVVLAASDGDAAVQAPLSGLAEGATYHFRLVAENEAGTLEGADLSFKTARRGSAPLCSNAVYRSGLSAGLPDCRVYELVTPAETRGATPYAGAPSSAGQGFDNWLVTPRGPGAGESLAFSIDGTLPGYDGTGKTDAYRARRGKGPHPTGGWTTELISPSFAEVGGGGARAQSVAANHDHWLYSISNFGDLESGIPTGKYLLTPSGFEAIGRGSLDVDLEASGRFVSAGGDRLIFVSDQHLEPEAAPAGTAAIYSRAAGSSTATVVSVQPGGAPFGAGEAAAYRGVSEDGSTVAFEVGGVLYVHRGGVTTVVADGGFSFAGLSEDGGHAFFADAPAGAESVPPATLYACDIEAAPCVGGGEPPGLTEIAAEARLITASLDGSVVLFGSETVLTGAEQNEVGESAEPGEPNLYAWDGAVTRFAGVLDPRDFESFDEDAGMHLLRWAFVLSSGTADRASSPTRATPDGEAFVFQSHARLTEYDNEGIGQIYRYEPSAPLGERLLCVSCNPSGAPSSADAMLQTSIGGVARGNTLITNITDDGSMVFFESPDRLLPVDANEARDVYRWKVRDGAGCDEPGGCLALISSGQGESDNYLFGMSGAPTGVMCSSRPGRSWSPRMSRAARRSTTLARAGAFLKPQRKNRARAMPARAPVRLPRSCRHRPARRSPATAT